MCQSPDLPGTTTVPVFPRTTSPSDHSDRIPGNRSAPPGGSTRTLATGGGRVRSVGRTETTNERFETPLPGHSSVWSLHSYLFAKGVVCSVRLNYDPRPDPPLPPLPGRHLHRSESSRPLASGPSPHLGTCHQDSAPHPRSMGRACVRRRTSTTQTYIVSFTLQSSAVIVGVHPLSKEFVYKLSYLIFHFDLCVKLR